MKFISCGACLTEQDYALFNKFDEALKDENDVVKLSEVYSTDWKEVCTTHGGYNNNLTLFADDKEKVNIMNNVSPYITEFYGESAIIFKYNQHDWEIFKITPTTGYYGRSLGKGCISKERAYLQKRKHKELNQLYILLIEKGVSLNDHSNNVHGKF